MWQTPDGLMEVRIQSVTFTKSRKDGAVTHHARIITYVDERKHRLVNLLTNDMNSDPDEIIAIYRQPAADGDATRSHSLMEFLQPRHNGKD